MTGQRDVQRLGAVELGGTKAIALLTEGENILERVTAPTTTPEETLSAIHTLLQKWHAQAPLQALGIASFGPLQLSQDQADFGRMLPTPKPNWSGADILGTLSSGLCCPVLIDTDVNAAALAEHRWGAAQGSDSLCYVTIGTGLGGGFLIDGRPIHGAMHPEIGHLRIRRAEGDSFSGACPFHGDCLEGLVCGPALAARFGGDPAQIPDSDPRWKFVASDLAEMVITILLTGSCRQILIGGGVGIARKALLPLVHEHVIERLAGYLPFVTRETIGDIIRAPGLGADAGPMGAVALALDAAALNNGQSR
ncbi:ROK family protein [Altericroceibacterium endophyticum]|uniref:fructokinase n=1 Tax=Altericroceibacterium endophyticum TaxID=1808508 RepID=A0A6I4T6Y0_9SPHN|nr:ROK family protein [Altericroceibacterium endophyticum]MXO66418.1 ROK family protein [Altericroceibacterium endophyticum]